MSIFFTKAGPGDKGRRFDHRCNGTEAPEFKDGKILDLRLRLQSFFILSLALFLGFHHFGNR